MGEDKRSNYIRQQVAVIWRSFGRRLNLDDPKDLAVADDYVKALERVPTKRLEYVIQLAKNLEKLPRARDMYNLWKPPESTGSPDRKQIFRPRFAEWLSDVAAMADYLFAQSKQTATEYRLMAEICGQAHLPAAGAVKRLAALSSTEACIDLMAKWFAQAGVSGDEVDYVLEQVAVQRDNAEKAGSDARQNLKKSIEAIWDV